MWPSVAEMLSMLNELEVVIRTKETGISMGKIGPLRFPSYHMPLCIDKQLRYCHYA